MILSIIIPIYNTEKYLESCVESIVKKQNEMDDYEIILINDGSTDGSYNICLKLASSFPEIKIYNSINMGVSHARNIGLQNAQGDYIAFMDSDDWLSNDGLVNLLKDCHFNMDYIIYGIEKVFFVGDDIEKREVKVGKSEYYSRKEFSINYSYIDNSFNLASVCGKLFRTSILRNKNIRFDEIMRQYEDVKFNLEYLCYCKTIYCSERIIYHWRRILNEKRAKRIYINMFKDVSSVAHAMIEFSNEIGLNGLNGECIYNNSIARYSDCFKNYKFLSEMYSKTEIVDTLLEFSKDDVLMQYIPQKGKYPKKMKILFGLAKLRLYQCLYIYLIKVYR